MPLLRSRSLSACHFSGDAIGVKVAKLDSVKTQLTYDYYSLPFCRPPTIEESAENLGEALSGDRVENSMYKVRKTRKRTGYANSGRARMHACVRACTWADAS